MPKCMMDGCNSETKAARGVAAAQGWVVFDLQGPNGNKYGNVCPEHKAKEIKARLVELFDQVVKE